ncbi:peptidase C39 [Anatilimnocola sp. NA78]|uniref:peptidase C39 n=1 Tax=Anatilimnocola sp. NA78 TaxID=3415683 RepID=UPI003CE4E40C
MTDIWIAIAVMSLLSMGAAIVAARYLSPQTGQSVMLGLALSVAAAIFFLLYGAGQLFWARLVPSSAAIIYTNLAAILAAMAAGWGSRLPNTPLWRRSIMALALAGASLAAILWPLLSIALRPPPAGKDQWQGPVAMQTSWATCSPAAAATLLRAEGIPVSESDMIPLCLTDYDGTPTLGLYRGIKLMASRHQRQIEIVDSRLEKLLADDDWPVLMAVRLPRGVDDPRFEQEWGWIPGMGHSVVALGRRPSGELVVADPAIGLELWSESKLQTLWQGNGLRVK